MKFISAQDYTTQDEAKAAYPEAAVIQPVDGGYMVFDTVQDHITWWWQK